MVSEPVTALVDESPLAVLPDGGLVALKLTGIFKAGLDHPLLVFVDKSPFAAWSLNGSQALAEGSDVAVFGAG